MADIVNQTALELVQFVVDPDAEAAMLAARPAAVAAIRRECPGLVDARLFRGEGVGTWIDVWFWERLEQAASAAQVAVELPEAAAFFAFISEPPAMIHGTLVSADVLD